MTEHIGERAERFALGVLEPHEAAAVEAHASNCTHCSVELGRAETTVAALCDSTMSLHEPPPRLAERLRASASLATPRLERPTRLVDRFRGWYAVAALLILGLLIAGSVAENLRLRHGLAADDLAFATIATSHFRHVSFTGSVPAKVLYARDGAWAYVIVAVSDCRCRVVARDSGASKDLGVPQRRGTTETLFIGNFERAHSLALIDARQAVVGIAALTY